MNGSVHTSAPYVTFPLLSYKECFVSKGVSVEFNIRAAKWHQYNGGSKSIIMFGCVTCTRYRIAPYAALRAHPLPELATRAASSLLFSFCFYPPADW